RRHTRCYRDWSSDVCSSDLRNRSDAPRRKPRVSEITAKREAGADFRDRPVPACFERLVMGEVVKWNGIERDPTSLQQSTPPRSLCSALEPRPRVDVATTARRP